MNNQLINNNNIPEQPQSNQSTVPTFGGRFFPSLEDEPTNMAFNNVIESTTGVVPGPQPANNLIDLTDTGNTISNLVMPGSAPSMPQMEQPLGPNMAPPQENIIDNGIVSSNNGSIIDIASLTQNNNIASPVQEPAMPINVDNNFQEVISDFQPNPTQDIMAPPLQSVIEPSPVVNPVELNQNPVMPEQPILNNQAETVINPMNQEFVTSVPNIDSTIGTPINMTQEVISTPVEQGMVNQMPENINITTPEMMTSPVNSMAGFDNSVVQPMPEPIVQEPIVQEPVVVSQPVENSIAGPEMATPTPQKDILPVINTLKAVGVNLENFGYTIRITDEDLPNSYKITIEVEK